MLLLTDSMGVSVKSSKSSETAPFDAMRMFTADELRKAFSEEPEVQDFILPGFLRGTVGALIAQGGTGKSMFALQLACQIASAFDGSTDLTGINVSENGKVLYMSLEDPEIEIRRRLSNMNKDFKFSEDAITEISENLTIAIRHGMPVDIMDPKFMVYITEQCKDKRMLIVDTFSRIHRMDENSNGDMAQVVSQLEKIAHESKASILYLHHVSKHSASSSGTSQQLARGASALIDNARFAMVLNHADKKNLTQVRADTGKQEATVLELTVVKQNYGLKMQPIVYYTSERGLLHTYSSEKRTLEETKKTTSSRGITRGK